MATKKASKKAATNKSALAKCDPVQLSTTIAALREREVPCDSVCVVHGDAAQGLLVLHVNKFNRVVRWHHVGDLARSMRVWHDRDNPGRYIELVTAIVLGAERGTTDGQHRELAKVVAYGTREQVEELCLLYGITTTDEDEHVVADIAKLQKLTKVQLVGEDGDWVGYDGEKYGYPRTILTVDTDDHYYAIADQVQLKRTGSDVLSGDPHCANALTLAALPFRDAEKILRLVYLRGMRSINGDGSKFGSTKRGGNIPAARYAGFYALFGRLMVEEWERLTKVLTATDDLTFRADRLRGIGLIEICAAMTLARLDELKGTYVGGDDYKKSDAEIALGYETLAQVDPTTFGDTLTMLGTMAVATNTSKITSNAECLLAEVATQNRIQQREKIAALVDILAYGIYDMDWPTWSRLYMPFLRDGQDGTTDVEQFVGLRFYGPDSTGWNKQQLAIIAKGANR